jgi:Ca2+-binding EF-hand superfamily protein
MGSIICGKFNKKENNESKFHRIYTNESKDNLEIINKIGINNTNKIKSIYLNSISKSRQENNSPENKNDNDNNFVRKDNLKIKAPEIIKIRNINKNKNKNKDKDKDNDKYSLNSNSINYNDNGGRSNITNNNIKSNITTNSLKSNLLRNPLIIKIKEKFYLSTLDITKLYDCFFVIDKEGTGYMTIIDLYKILEENPSTSIIGPFIDRFFNLIEKKNYFKVTFVEFLPNLISFCLFSTFQIIEFMFHFIDKDHNNFISKNDIKNILRLKREDMNIFFENYIESIKYMKGIRRFDKIDIDDFFEICKSLPFIFHPLIILQEKLKKKFLGIDFWKKLNLEIRKKFTEKLKDLENGRINKNINIMLEQKKKEKNKIKENEEKTKIYNERIRIHTRRNSDSDFFIGRYDELKENKKNQLKEPNSFNANI